MRSRSFVLLGLVVAAALCGLAGCDWLFPPHVTPPQTLGFAPTSGAVRTIVTVVGQGFGPSVGDGAVIFDGKDAEVETWSDTNIVVRVPVLATPDGELSANVEVRRSGTLLGQGTFTVVRGILFQSYRDGDSEIYVMNPDGTQQTNLTDDPGSDTFPMWSPDGTKIAFQTERDGNLEIYVMGADGSDPTNLSEHPDADYFPVWSPDGEKIAFMTDREVIGPVVLGTAAKITIGFDVEIYVMNDDGTGQANLTNNTTWDGYPSWSPDGTRIAFETNRDSGGISIEFVPDGLGYEIYAMDEDGSDPVRLSNSPGDDLYPQWSPDGSKIAFEAHRDGNAEIYAMNADGTGQVRLTDEPAADSMPTWSPSGAWITFHSYRDGNTEIYKMAASGSSLTRLTNSSSWDWGPSWSLDEEDVVFQSARDGNPEIYRMKADGSSPVRLTNETETDIHPFWGTFNWMPPA